MEIVRSFDITNTVFNLLIELFKPRSKAHVAALIVTGFFWFVYFVLIEVKPEFMNDDTRLLFLSTGGLFLSVLFGFALINYLKQEDKKAKTELQAISSVSSFNEHAEAYALGSKERGVLIIYMQLKARLDSEVSSLWTRANLNLTIGIITSVIGVGILASLAIDLQGGSIAVHESENAIVNVDVDGQIGFWGPLFNYLPRLTLVLLIELFAFFFLRMYKYNLSEMKYFQNEITNVEMKMMALLLSLDDKSSNLAKVVDSFVSVERNFVIQKDQKTISDLDEKTKNDLVNTVFEKTSSLLNSKP